MDALMVLLLTLTLFDLWDWLERGSRSHLRRAALWAGLGVLGKGPMALVIPGLVVGAFLLATPPMRVRWRGVLDPWAWLICVGIAAPWYVWYGLQSHGAFIDYFFWRENAGRLGGSLQGHGGSPLYYLLVLPLLLLPHGGVLVALCRNLGRLWREPLERFLLLWFLCVFGLFSLAGTKLPHYLLYGCPPLFLLGGRCLAETRVDDRLRLWAGVLGSLLLPILTLSLPWLAGWISASTGNPYLAEMFARSASVFGLGYRVGVGLWLLLALVLAVLQWRTTRHRQTPRLYDSKVVALPQRSLLDPRWAVIAPGLLSAGGISFVLLPILTGLQQDPVRSAAYFAAALGEPVVSDDRMPSFSVYLGHPTEVRALRTGDLAFGRLDHPEQLGKRHEVLFAEGGIRVVRVLEP
jgi:4-amino-4-deoxy-L-arabinose transferase-like glycosyltransferase